MVISLKSAHLTLVPLLQALLRDRSVTLAARRLGITQSAASQGLARLRAIMNDALLVRIGGRMELTPRAMSLVGRVETIFAELEYVFRLDSFDPATAQRTFIIAASDYMAHLVARPMLDLVRVAAPGVEIHFIEIAPDFAIRMAAREIDFALIPKFAVRDYTRAPLRFRTLLKDEPGVLMDRSHPLARLTTISKDDLKPYGHVAFRVEALERMAPDHSDLAPEVAMLAAAIGKITVHTNHVTLIPALLQGTDLVSIITYGMASNMGRIWPTVARRLSFGPRQIDVGMAWSPVFDADPAHAWFRTQVEAACIARKEPFNNGAEYRDME